MTEFPTNKIEGLVPPQELEIERYVIASILTEPRLINNAIDNGITSNLFYLEAHSIIMEVIFNLHKDSRAIDMLNVVKELNSQGNLAQAGGASGIANISQSAASGSHLVDHILNLKELYAQRTAIQESSELQRMAYKGASIDDIVTQQSKALDAISGIFSNDKALTNEELVEATIKDVEKRAKFFDEFGVVMGVRSGIPSIDKVLNGFKPANVYVLAARPSVGKTAFALKLLKGFASQNIPTAIFSLEMSSKELMDRLILSEAGINSDKYMQGDISPQDWVAINNAAETLYNMPILVQDDYALTVEKLRAKISILKAKENIGAVIIDYLQLITPNSKNKSYSKTDEVGDISRAIKSMSKEFDIPIILLSQLNRSAESTADKKPMLSHLRSSGDIEQDASVVMLLYRPSIYDITEDADGKSYPDNYMEVMVVKNRSGKVGTVRLLHSESMSEFMEYTTTYEEELETFTDY